MPTKPLTVCLFMLLLCLGGCTASPARDIESSPTPEASLTWTAFNPPAPSTTPVPATPVLWTATFVPPSATATVAPLDAASPQPTVSSTPSLRVNLEAVGDIMLARTVGQQILAQGPQVTFAGVQSVLEGADLLVGNLECALTSGRVPQSKTYTFAAPPQAVQSLASAGFDVLGLANNHAMDFGVEGLADTLKYLTQNGIQGVGAGTDAAQAHRPVILERNGLRLAFLAYAAVPVENNGFDAQIWTATDSRPGIAWADPGQIRLDVGAAKKEADVVIVLLHSGYEITTIIPGISSGQRLDARAAIDAGASVVIGSHPHFLQSIELYHGGLIAYSLGNFVFDDYQGIANASIILRVELTRDGFQGYEWVPVVIKNGLPELTDINSTLAISTMIAPLTP